MKQKEVVDLIKLIDRTYKTDYAGDKEIVNDWYKILRNYDLEDMTSSLDYYMKNYTDYAPKVYDLIRGYKTIDSKKLLETAKTRCIFCGKVIKIDDVKHEDRCRSIEFIKSVAHRFKGQEIVKDKYLKMSDEEFNKYHLAAVNLVINKSSNELEVSMWKKYLENIK